MDEDTLLYILIGAATCCCCVLAALLLFYRDDENSKEEVKSEGDDHSGTETEMAVTPSSQIAGLAPGMQSQSQPHQGSGQLPDRMPESSDASTGSLATAKFVKTLEKTPEDEEVQIVETRSAELIEADDEYDHRHTLALGDGLATVDIIEDAV